MKNAIHFGAGNIGRGFIGQVLHENGFEITFVDVNSKIIDALNQIGQYDIILAAPDQKKIHVEGVKGINNANDPDKVVKAFDNVDVVTTAIGPKILPIIAPLIAQGISERAKNNNTKNLDVIACENMIGGSQSLKKDVYSHLDDDTKAFADKYIGFPNAAVDRIVPAQNNKNLLDVSVEPFKEWIIDDSQRKNKDLNLDSVIYVPDLEPYIERKLFSVNTGHASIAYTGKYLGYKTIIEAIKDKKCVDNLHGALAETQSLLIAKWKFDKKDINDYQNTVMKRFANPYISDNITRVARTPIRKLGYNERFIRPIRELKERGLDYTTLVNVAALILTYDAPADAESVKLQAMIKSDGVEQTIKTVTGLKDQDLINQILAAYKKL